MQAITACQPRALPRPPQVDHPCSGTQVITSQMPSSAADIASISHQTTGAAKQQDPATGTTTEAVHLVTAEVTTSSEAQGKKPAAAGHRVSNGSCTLHQEQPKQQLQKGAAVLDVASQSVRRAGAQAATAAAAAALPAAHLLPSAFAAAQSAAHGAADAAMAAAPAAEAAASLPPATADPPAVQAFAERFKSAFEGFVAERQQLDQQQADREQASAAEVRAQLASGQQGVAAQRQKDRLWLADAEKAYGTMSTACEDSTKHQLAFKGTAVHIQRQQQQMARATAVVNEAMSHSFAAQTAAETAASEAEHAAALQKREVAARLPLLRDATAREIRAVQQDGAAGKQALSAATQQVQEGARTVQAVAAAQAKQQQAVDDDTKAALRYRRRLTAWTEGWLTCGSTSSSMRRLLAMLMPPRAASRSRPVAWSLGRPLLRRSSTPSRSRCSSMALASRSWAPTPCRHRQSWMRALQT